MYLRNIYPSEVKKLETIVSSNGSLLDVYKKLKANEYQIYYKFDEENTKITYYALHKQSGEPRFLSFSVSGDKEISDYYPSYAKNDPFSKSLALFVIEEDSNASEDALKKRYEKGYSSIAPIANLSKKKASDYLKAKSSLIVLKKDLLSSYLSQSKKRLKVEYLFASERGERFSLRLSVGTERMYLVNDLPRFFASIFAGEAIHMGKNQIDGGSYELEEIDRVAFLFSSTRLSYYYLNKTGELKEEDFVSLLVLLQGKSVDFDDLDYRITPKEEASLSIGENGNIILSRPLADSETALFSSKNAALIDTSKRIITLLSFKSENEEKLYRFAISSENFPYELLADELGKNIVPLLDKGTKVDEKFLQNHRSEISNIHYAISYSENDVLECKTTFYLGLREIEEEAFLQTNEINALRLERFKNELAILSLPSNGSVTNQNTILSFLHADLKTLGDSCKLYLSDNLVNATSKAVSPIRIETKSGQDWFSLSMESDSYSKEELTEIFNAYKKHKKFVRLHGSFIVLDDHSEIASIAKEYSGDDLGQKLPFYEVFKLNRSSNNVSLSDALVQLIHDVSSYQNVSLSQLSDSLQKTLRPYQKDGVRWLLAHDKYHLGGILADEMGLGKTLETIAFLSCNKEEEPILIVSPKSLIYNWESEFHRFDPSREVMTISGNAIEREKAILKMKNSKKAVFIISYDTLRNDIEKIVDIQFSYLFLDEAQFIANAFAKKSKAVKRIKAKHRYVLTGTPIQNSLLDLWSIFDFLLPGYFPSFKDFKLEYGGFEYADKDSELHLRYRIEPFFLKRTKKEVLKELPPKEEHTMIVALSEEQRKLYESYLLKTRELLKGTKERKEASELDKKTSKLVILSALTRLREICVDPSMFLECDFESEKLLALIDSIMAAIENGHKVIVFSSFAKALSHIQSMLSSLHIDSYFIYGDISAKKRLEMANAFNSLPDIKVMLVSLKAGGTGLNLIGADLVYHLDPWWNLAAEEQASDRAHRLGQKRKVTIYKMIAKDTIEEKVLELQNKKKNLASILTSEDGQSIKNLTDEDIAYLLS